VIELRSVLAGISAAAFGGIAAYAGLLAAVVGASLPVAVGVLGTQTTAAQARLDEALKVVLHARPEGWRDTVLRIREADRRLAQRSLPATLLSVVAAGTSVFAAFGEHQRAGLALGIAALASLATVSLLWQMRAAERAARQLAFDLLVDDAAAVAREHDLAVLTRARTARPTAAAV
jgi:hypothetical protein